MVIMRASLDGNKMSLFFAFDVLNNYISLIIMDISRDLWAKETWAFVYYHFTSAIFDNNGKLTIMPSLFELECIDIVLFSNGQKYFRLENNKLPFDLSFAEPRNKIYEEINVKD